MGLVVGRESERLCQGDGDGKGERGRGQNLRLRLRRRGEGLLRRAGAGRVGLLRDDVGLRAAGLRRTGLRERLRLLLRVTGAVQARQAMLEEQSRKAWRWKSVRSTRLGGAPYTSL